MLYQSYNDYMIVTLIPKNAWVHFQILIHVWNKTVNRYLVWDFDINPFCALKRSLCCFYQGCMATECMGICIKSLLIPLLWLMADWWDLLVNCSMFLMTATDGKRDFVSKIITALHFIQGEMHVSVCMPKSMANH